MSSKGGSFEREVANETENKSNRLDTYKYYVYVYLDPRKPGKFVYEKYEFNYEPFYIGKGSGDRMSFHMKQIESINKQIQTTYFYTKIMKIISTHNNPKMLIIQNNLQEDDAYLLEENLIKIIGRSDLNEGPLTNLTNGGDGQRGMSDITRAKISKTLQGVGHLQTEETKRKISKKKKGVKQSKTHREHLKDKNKGRKCSVEEIRKRNESRIKNGTKRKPATEETRKKQSISALKRGISDETRAKMYMTRMINNKRKREAGNAIIEK